MQNFKDIRKSSEIGKSDYLGRYKDIVPNNKMSSGEVEAFWKSEFAEAHDQSEIDPYDALLSEVFNCSEEDFHPDVEIDEDLQNVLDRFSPESWAGTDESEKIDAIENLKDLICEKLDLYEAPEVSIYEKDSGEYGAYNAENNTINLNGNHFDDPKELVDTIAHELRHAYQHYRAGLLETHKDELYRVNFENYISPLPLPAGGYLFFMDYWNQYVEVDARTFANKFTEAME